MNARRHPNEVECLSCGKPIVFFHTPRGRRIPIDAESTRPSDKLDELDLKRHVAHFSTCPHANQWRQTR